MAVARNSYRWGILGTSAIAGQFAAQLVRTGNGRLHGVASRDSDRAKTIAADWGAKTGYGSYDALVADPAIDVVYIGTPAALHRDHCVMALQAGKPVLCEKPFALTAAEARTVVSAAADARLFCMEAMWMRFSPLLQQLRSQVLGGAIGAIRFFTADLGYRTTARRLASADPANGALLNFGVYGVSLAHFLFGPPSAVRSDRKTRQSALDTSFSASLEYPDLLATVQGSIEATLPNGATVIGTNGQLRLGAPFIDPGSLQAVRVGEPPATPPASHRGSSMAEKLPFGGLLQGSFLVSLLKRQGQLSIRPRGANGLKLEAEEVMRCLDAGRTESAIMPLGETVAVMETLDLIRAGWTG